MKLDMLFQALCHVRQYKTKNALESIRKVYSAEFTHSKGYWAGGKQWCAGRLTMDNNTDLIAELVGKISVIYKEKKNLI